MLRDSFNGAGVLRPRKWISSRLRSVPLNRLQWGRGLKTPEMRESPAKARQTASLQWGRGLKTPEMGTDIAIIGTEVTLQWGRGLKTPEI